ncbi:MAG: DNA-processing protein DprA [Lachnospiraceae bacterium]|nr:DNA-processing protein DprA [Lachnospiraceae bacterium]
MAVLKRDLKPEELPVGSMRYVDKNDGDWPKRFEGLAGMPEGLYVLGEMPDPDLPTVAIVGSRLCSAYGHAQADAFGRSLASHGVQVISGMALGIDGYAQQGALEAGGKSFAVLGCGADICYPKTNRKLYRELIGRGGILSEYPPGTQPYSYNFPRRNRIISALADIVLVVEARKKSGSLITVDFALEQGKNVFAVPGRVGDALSDGCNYLIAQGAGIAWAPEAVLEELRFQAARENLAERRKKRGREMEKILSGKIGELHYKQLELFPFPKEDEKLSENAKRILACLTADPKGTEEISARTELGTPEIMDGLIELSLGGYADEVGRGRFIKKTR